jgi:hypothetical protein
MLYWELVYGVDSELLHKVIRGNYDIIKILDLISEHIMPIKETKSWGYSPYFFDRIISMSSQFCCFPVGRGENEHIRFQALIETIPNEMRTKCRREYVKELFQKYKITYKQI